MGRKLISFDWAIKKILRSKVNFCILEGFLSVLLKDDVEILEIIESESNKDDDRDKSNRVDIKIKDKQGQVIIVEVQFAREYDYLNRMLYGTSKAITEHMQKGYKYAKVVKVISVNIMFMGLAGGDDYVYHGITSFKGIHTHSPLTLSTKERELLSHDSIAELYPEYFIIDVSNFDNLAKNPLDEWIYFLKNQEVKESFKAPGLQEAQENLDLLKMSRDEKINYDDYVHWRRREMSRYESSRIDGYDDGLEKGLKKGLEKGLKKGLEKGIEKGMEKGIEQGREEKKQAVIDIAISLLDVLDDEIIALKTKLSVAEISALREN